MKIFIAYKSLPMAGKYKLTLLAISILAFSACYTQKQIEMVRPAAWAIKIDTTGFANLYKVDKDLYRSEQPNHKDMVLLQAIGIKTIINLRHNKTDQSEAKDTRLKLAQEPIYTGNISYENIISAFKLIMAAEKPLLIHCLKGSDRTGCMVSVYRMVKCGWTREEAIREFKEGGFGYHENWFPNILRLLQTIDLEQLKKDLAKKE